MIAVKGESKNRRKFQLPAENIIFAVSIFPGDFHFALLIFS
jgi:hypothetical protein